MLWWGKKKRSTTRATDPGLEESCVVEASFLSDQGPRRTSNEDSAAVVVPQDPEHIASKGTLVLVADGMGGHEGGEVASEMAARLISEAYYADQTDPQTSLVNAYHLANRAIFDHAKRQPQLTGMGTTCTAVAIVDGLAYSAHVGDSRAYLVRAGQLYQMTEDHSQTMEMVKQGMITLQEAREHPDRNVILRAMGTHKDLEVAVWETPFALRPGDRFVLCSDGLHEMVTDDEICAITAANEYAQACAQMMQLALERISSDNVTVAVAQVYPPGARNGHGPKETRVL
ncbi:MAG TPA: Stp1/IreP family PP2C-type Ser/Thr phosphatase [Bryobacteraceae bacterium]|jgi:protein phosphatase